MGPGENLPILEPEIEEIPHDVEGLRFLSRVAQEVDKPIEPGLFGSFSTVAEMAVGHE